MIRRSERYNRSLIDASLDPLVTITADGTIGDVNDATELATGLPREELIGTDFSEYFTNPEAAKAGYEKVFQEGFVQTTNSNFPTVTGKQHPSCTTPRFSVTKSVVSRESLPLPGM